MKEQLDMKLDVTWRRSLALLDECRCKIINAMNLVNESLRNEKGDVPGWVLVVLMTTGLVTGIWTLAAPRIDSILRNSLDSMNGIR